jgi:hypothetical protein
MSSSSVAVAPRTQDGIVLDHVRLAAEAAERADSLARRGYVIAAEHAVDEQQWHMDVAVALMRGASVGVAA